MVSVPQLESWQLWQLSLNLRQEVDVQHIHIDDPKTIERRAWLTYGAGILTGLVLCAIAFLIVM